MTEIIKYLNHKVNGNIITYPIGTELKFIESKDNSLLIQTEKTTLDKILPLKVNQETIDNNTTNITSLNNIDKQGLYYISKTGNLGQPNSVTAPFNLLVLTNGDSFKQILFKEEKIYIRDNISSTWSAALAEPFTGSNTTNSGIKGLVPPPSKAAVTDNWFLKSNGNWTNLNGTFARLGGESETFEKALTFSKGFTSQGDTSSTFKNTVSITATPTDGRALSVTNGISAGNISASGNGKFGSINIGNTEVINDSCVGKFASIISTSGISITNGGVTADNGIGKFASISASGNISTTGGNISTSKGDISTDNGNITASGNGSFGSITSTGEISITNGGVTAANGTVSANILSITSTTDIKPEQDFNNNTTCAARIAGGLYAQYKIKSDDGIYNAVWNDLADSIVVNKDAEIEAGYCYCLKDNKYIKSSKYLDNGIIGIHSDTYGFKMGEKAGEKQLDCAVAGFVLAYVDKDYLPGTALTCTKDGRLTKIKSKDKQRFPEKIVATYWKDEPNEEWGSDNRKVKVNGRKWVKIK